MRRLAVLVVALAVAIAGIGFAMGLGLVRVPGFAASELGGSVSPAKTTRSPSPTKSSAPTSVTPAPSSVTPTASPSPSEDFVAPNPVTGFTLLSNTNTDFTLGWTAGTDNVGVVGYQVTLNGVLAAVSTEPRATLPFPAGGGSATVQVAAVDKAGNVSEWRSVVIKPPTPSPTTTAPATSSAPPSSTTSATSTATATSPTTTKSTSTPLG